MAIDSGLHVQRIPFQVYKKMSQSHYISSYVNAKEKMLKNINSYSQGDAFKLQKNLNKIFKQMNFTEEARKELNNAILERLPIWAKKGQEDGLKAVATANADVVTDELINAKKDLQQAQLELMNIENDLQAIERAEAKIETLQSKVSAIGGKVNKYKGDLFEGLLQFIGPYISEKTATITKEGVKGLLEAATAAVEQKTTIKTLGNDNVETITYTVGDEQVSISSQGKTDVVMNLQKFNGEDLFVSAKNYSQIRDIHLLGNANLAGLVSQWEVSNMAKNYFINSMTVWNTPQDVLEAGKFLFAIQGISGARGIEIKSNALIINIRSRINPIRVISIPAILQDIFKNNTQLNEESETFYFKFDPNPPWFTPTGLERSPENFKEAVKAGKLSISLAKSKIMLSYLRRIARSGH